MSPKIILSVLGILLAVASFVAAYPHLLGVAVILACIAHLVP